MKITNVEVKVGGVFSPKAFTSLSCDVGMNASLSDGDDPVQSIKRLQLGIRKLINSAAQPTLANAGKLALGENTWILSNTEAVLGQALQSDDEFKDLAIGSLTAGWKQTWQIEQGNFLKSEVNLFAELEGEDPKQAAQELLQTAKTLVREDAKPLLEAAGYFNGKRATPAQKTREWGQEQDVKPALPAIPTASDSGIFT